MNWLKPLTSLSFSALLLASAAQAQSNEEVSFDTLKIGLRGDNTDVLPALRGSRLVTFRYNPDVSFAVRALEDTYVNVEVPDDEVIEGLYLSDATQWSYHVAGDNRRVLIKPLAPGLVNTGTLITDKRSYELTMISVPLGEMWFQRVRWQVPGKGADSFDGTYWRGQSKAGAAGTNTSAPNPSTSSNLADVDPASLNFDYQIKGKAKFAPTTVFDDGVRTWFRFNSIQDLPAIFAKREDGMEVVDHSIQGDYIVVPLISPSFVLQLHKTRVTVDRSRRRTR